MPEKPLDVLAQQVVAEVSCREYGEEELFSLFKRAYPYRGLERKEYDDVVEMLSRGFSARKGRRGAYIHHDVVNGRLRTRKGARLAALISGGTIPDSFDYDVVLEPTNTFIGTVNEDFAIESVPGDIFLLGNHSWRILKVSGGKVRVEDAGMLPPTIPFWFGEVPGRTVEFSEAVSRLREEVSERLGDLKDLKREGGLWDSSPEDTWKKKALHWLMGEVGLNLDAADQLTVYLATVKAALGVMPTQKKLVMERFFDEAGAMHLVIHSPYGSRLNRAWGLSLRKCFCRKFNFELQAAATEDSIILSLGATHSFSLEEVYHYLHPSSVRGVLTQALLDSPMFEVCWRWNASTALAVLRRWTEKRIPPAVQRIHSEDLIAQVFPDQIACFENIAGEREIPDHPLVNQTIHDCLYEAIDIENLESLLGDICSGRIGLKARDLREPSPFSQQILNARPYAFLDDAPLEERRTHAVQNRRRLDPSEAQELGELDEEAIGMVREEAWPEVETADELHDALILCGFLTEHEGVSNGWRFYFKELTTQNRALAFKTSNEKKLWVAVERVSEIKALHPDSSIEQVIKIPERLTRDSISNENPLVEIVRSRLEVLGPVSVSELSGSIGISSSAVDQALLLLEGEGFVFRGRFTPGREELESCERRLLARIHKYTLSKLRKEIQPVSASDYMRFLFSWHGVDAAEKPEGVEALRRVLGQLEGVEAPAASWEGDILPSRLKDYDHTWLDALCLSGSAVWGRFRTVTGKGNTRNRKPSPIKTTPISIVNRVNLEIWKQLGSSAIIDTELLSNRAVEVLKLIKERGASFFEEIIGGVAGLRSETEGALAELVAKGIVTSDSYTGLRALLVRPKYRTERGRRRKRVSFNMEGAGRWSLIRSEVQEEHGKTSSADMRKLAMIFLRRYGMVFRKILERESFSPQWRELVRALRVLELRGEARAVRRGCNRGTVRSAGGGRCS